MRPVKVLSFVLVLAALTLAGCSARTAPAAVPTFPGGASDDLARTDQQGSVNFEVTPLNLDTPGGTLDFNVAMNTHSVGLNWDLAAQSVLRTDTDREVVGQSWPGGSGHHVEAVLSFPAKTAYGQALLEGARQVTLVIRDAGAAERTFEWTLAP